jgi:hypothetical protein
MSEQTRFNSEERTLMSEKMPVVDAIRLVNSLGYNSGDQTIFWGLVDALRKGMISPDSLRHRDR